MTPKYKGVPYIFRLRIKLDLDVDLGGVCLIKSPATVTIVPFT